MCPTSKAGNQPANQKVSVLDSRDHTERMGLYKSDWVHKHIVQSPIGKIYRPKIFVFSSKIVFIDQAGIE